MIDYYNNNMHIIFPGSGFLGSYCIGVLSILEQIWPHHPYSKLFGASSGGIVALAAASGVPLPIMAATFYKLNIKCTELGWSPRGKNVCNITRELLEDVIPFNGHKRASGVSGISITNWSNFTNIMATHFESRADLLDAMIAAGWIPLVTGPIKAPKYLGTPCADGAWTNNLPKLELDRSEIENGTRQVTAWVFSGLVEVCPEFIPSRLGTIELFGAKVNIDLKNLFMTFDALSACKFDVVSKILEQGYRDMKRYIIENNYLRCRECHEASIGTSLDDDDSSNSGKHKIEISNNNIYNNNNSNKRACLRCLLLIERVSNLRISQALIEEPVL